MGRHSLARLSYQRERERGCGEGEDSVNGKGEAGIVFLLAPKWIKRRFKRMNGQKAIKINK